jgi:hypothetical protein
MDYSLVALIVVMIAAAFAAVRLGMWSWPGRPGYEYQRVFSAGAAGLLFTIAGMSGCELRKSYRFVNGTRWADSPIWWQIGVGAALLLLAFVWARRVPPEMK